MSPEPSPMGRSPSGPDGQDRLTLFNDALSMLDKTEWPCVEERLNDPDGEQVANAAMDYACAVLAADIMRDMEPRWAPRLIKCEKDVVDTLAALRLLVGDE
jgi:hypothetical protein